MKDEQPLKCYIAAFKNAAIDSALESRGFSHGMIIFAIPHYGILFRCRAEGDLVDLEFGAFFALLKFVKTRLSEEKIKSVQIASSNPQFVFAFTGKTQHLTKDSARMKVLKEFQKQFKMAIAYCEPIKNQAYIPASEYPSLPEERSVKLSPDSQDARKPEFKPFQRGVRLR